MCVCVCVCVCGVCAGGGTEAGGLSGLVSTPINTRPVPTPFNYPKLTSVEKERRRDRRGVRCEAAAEAVLEKHWGGGGRCVERVRKAVWHREQLRPHRR